MKTLKKFYKLTGLCVWLLTAISANAQQKWHEVAVNNCGVEAEQPFLIKGNNYQLPDRFEGSSKALTCNYGGTIIYAFDRMDIHADYQLEVLFLADAEREQRLVTDGNELQTFKIEKNKEQRIRFDLPKKAFAYGQLVLVFEVLKGANAVVSELNLYSTNPKKTIPFEGEEKEALTHTQAYQINTNVNVDAVMPLYTPKPHVTAGVYQPEMLLNGTWLFNEKPETQFWKTKDIGGNDWKPIVVPGQWSMQGFAVDSMGTAGYHTSFLLPTDWNGKCIKLRFDGVTSDCQVYMNGQEIGKHAGGMTAFELDVTQSVQQGTNQLTVAVCSESMADMLGSLTQYAAHQLGGITRKVTLFAVPKVHVSDVRIETDLDEAYENARLKAFVSVCNSGDKTVHSSSVKLTIDGTDVLSEIQTGKINPGETWSGWVTADVSNPRKWDNEHPHLYTMKLELTGEECQAEIIEKRIGFRKIEVKGNQLLVNGKAVKLRGVCRHEAHPLTGRVISEELSRKDVELYRDGNCNFIRTSHYPPTEELLDICDELGMFVEVEAPVCWIGHHANENWKVLNYQDSKYYGYVLQANMETIHFYRNHPAVLFWSMANESYWNKEFAQIQEYVRKADTTRPFTFHDQAYGGFNNQGSTAPIANIHYPGPNGYKVVATSDRPMVYGEYCHLNVYNRSELVTDPGVRSDWALALKPTWENMYKTQGVLGGSIWSGIDDIFQLPDGEAVGYGPWGPIDGWRKPKPEYWDMKKVYSPVNVLTSELNPASNLIIDVENRYTFTNLNELQIHWKYGDEEGWVHTNIKPGGTGKLQIAIANPSGANQLYLAFRDPRGFVADEYNIPVGKQAQNQLPELASLPTKLSEKGGKITVTGKNFECIVDGSNGRIISVKKNGNPVLTGGPLLMVLPLNGGGCYPNHNANTPIFNDVCSGWKANSVKARKAGEDVEISVSGSYKEAQGEYIMKINSNGEITVDYSFTALQHVNPRQWGLVFETPQDYNKLFWRREGLWSIYPEDHISRPVGEAQLFYKGVPVNPDPRIEPSWPWSMNSNELGSNDFRSTRQNIWYAGLKNEKQHQVTARSNGTQHWRSWLENDRIRFLVADFVTAGNEMFLESYYAPYRKPLKEGETIRGTVMLVIE